METWVLIVIIASILVVGVILYLVLAGGDEEQAEEKKGEMEDTLDLNDPKVLKALSEDGLQVTVGQTQYLQVGDAGKKGFSWILNEDCDDVLAIEILEGPPMKEAAAEGDEKKEEAAEEGDKKEEKDEKKLRAEKEEAAEEKPEMDQVYMSATGKAAGNCTLSMAYAESWDFEEGAENAEDAKVISMNVTVAEAAKEEAAADGEEEKAE